MNVQELSERYGAQVSAGLETLWAKSKERAGGRTSLLVAHLLDTAAVAELLWDRYLPPVTRAALDEVAGGAGQGRRLFVWLCGVHDCGKATPAHQRLWPEGAETVRRTGLTWEKRAAKSGAEGGRWRHDRAGGLLAREVLSASGWQAEQVDWVWPLIAGHHGAFPTLGNLREPRTAKGQLRGKGAWRDVQSAVFDVFTQELGFADLGEVQPTVVPSRALQLQLSGLVVMADWIASDERHFEGMDELRSISLDASRERAEAAWKSLGLEGGWGALAMPGPDAFQSRFGCAPRPSQTMVVEAAHRMSGPGILVVEAPMGEGKTEAAQAAAEILAARFGADGVFVGMPSQATSDPMFTRTRRWLTAISPQLAARVALLHGKRAFNKEWKQLLESGGADPDAAFRGVDEFGFLDDPYGVGPVDCCTTERQAPAEWFLGAKRGLLAPFVVGTVDQLLYAATRTRHVMLRMAGLMGKVVVLDEVHACDIYMSQFLREALHWLGQAGVPVILLSATLPPAQRHALIETYSAGAASREEFPLKVPDPDGYPSVTAAWLGPSGEPQFHLDAATSWRPDLRVQVETVPEELPGPGVERQERNRLQQKADAALADLLTDELAGGGTALVIRNSVARAQSLYAELKGRFGEKDVRLLHARFTVADRAELTEEGLRLLGPQTPRPEGGRLILVATQLAEQSFDVDADLLVTDLAPVDLLLQRIGRVHRHEGTRRPVRLREPRVFVTGFQPRDDREPVFAYASEKIYGRHLLLRTAAVLPSAHGRWSIPGQVPALVKAVYGQDSALLPESWQVAGEAADHDQREKDRTRAEEARKFLLTPHGEHEKRTLAGLHYGGSSAGSNEQALRAAVRDGDESVEVVLVVQEVEGEAYRTLAGRSLGVNGDVAPELLEEVLGATVRLPAKFTPDALPLRPLPGWHGHPWLRHSRALVLDASHRAQLPSVTVQYDDEFGLREEQSTG
ncbi:CRISPR-associated helicase Cas3' [Streptomyces sp. UNOC14_S4]|uniref:CRISPR-associated helicase Cas3' n=1 Tax=Streptomyces sp. UNOC14_S4 TaxID=2872340 RepID=UPI001E2D405E|nr:CRISPR-associated helicase Cas3' [Streptomyces sp. UNOC14_S4]MCC3769503.1 CRISPR-associated helicase Cas3' [Streptomyces sp. UNOC14_S4]